MNISAKDLFAALAHPTRLRSLMLLMQYEELCVCDFTQALGAAQPHVSRHLGHLRALGLVKDRRAGLWIHYRLHPALPDWVQTVLQATWQGVQHTEPFVADGVKVSCAESASGCG